MTKPTVLIIDDEPDILELLDMTLARMNVCTQSATTMTQALTLLRSNKYALCLTDMRLPDGDGMSIVRHIQQHSPSTPIAMITAYGSLDTAINALKAGAFDFLTKPVDLQRLRELVSSALKLHQAPTEPEEQQQDPLLGISPPMESLRKQIGKLARSQAPLYISGESGSGKELVARRIHALGPRAEQPFVPVNCGAIPSELMESEFFGHRKGSFTGAVADKPGLFQAASHGTLFLDEVADLPIAMQVKLLRAIQEKAVRPLGTQQEESVDVRLLCATHKDLANEVAEGRFRQDLFYRINVIELQVPPLRERREDLPMLTHHILEKLALRNGMPAPRISDSCMELLCNYRFPGNVRELENTLERAFTLCENHRIETSDLQLSGCPSPGGDDGHDLSQIDHLEDFLDNIERQAITQALEETRWNKTAAAKRLGLTFRSLRYRLKKLGLDD
ncbi:MAG: sigma-54-dependent transcriptional regulator [Pseudomonadales bacterium]|tara:strand:- start:1596 stop:2939 length:1344 start_codon:yes stop_codon:yes gene_type:complete